MNGFRVETNALRDAGAAFRSASKNFEDVARRLRISRSVLKTQSLPVDIAELLASAISAADAIAEEVLDFSQQCVEISEVYDRTERKVSALVDALPRGIAGFISAASLDSSFSVSGDKKSLYDNDFILGMQLATERLIKRVDSPLIPAEPVLLCSNSLPCESWLLVRAMKAVSQKNEISVSEV